MNRMQSLIKSLVVFGVALAAITTLAAENVVQVNAKVVRIKGDARYKVGSGAWQTLKRGDELSAGTIIETGVNSRVDLMLGEGTPPRGGRLLARCLPIRPLPSRTWFACGRIHVWALTS